MSQKKKKPRRRTLASPARAHGPDEAQGAVSTRLKRAQAAAYALGGVALVAVFAAQCSAPAARALGSGGSMALRIGGVALFIAGWVLGRARR